MKIFRKLITILLVFLVFFGSIVLLYGIFPLKYTSLIRSVSEEAGVDPYLVTALIKAESNFKYDAVSQKGAKGLMQLTDETAFFCAEKIGIEIKEGDVYNPEVNIKLGVCYLKRTLDLFNSDTRLAVAAYNAGEGRVREWLADVRYSEDGKTLTTVPYEETKNHIEKIEFYQKMYRILYPNL